MPQAWQERGDLGCLHNFAEDTSDPVRQTKAPGSSTGGLLIEWKKEKPGLLENPDGVAGVGWSKEPGT